MLAADAAVDMSAFFPHSTEAVLPRHILAQRMVRSRLAAAAAAAAEHALSWPHPCIHARPASFALLFNHHCLSTHATHSFGTLLLQRADSGQLFAETTLGHMMLGKAMLQLLELRRQVCTELPPVLACLCWEHAGN